MKNFISYFLIASGLLGLSVSYAGECAQKICTLTVKNDTKETITFSFAKGKEVVPNLKESLSSGETQTVNIENHNQEEAYIRVEGSNGETTNAFFKVGPDKMSGYIGSKIAYSWNEGQAADITFCSPDNFKHGKCEKGN